MKISLTLLGLFVTMASSIELTSDNYEAETTGKVVFLKFFAPWCGHCKKLRPVWDELTNKFSGSATVLIAKIDCTAGGESLCNANGVNGYPTFKYGDPHHLLDYEGGKDLNSFLTFARKNLKPGCSPANVDLCDEPTKKRIETFMEMSTEDLEAKITVGEATIAEAEETYKVEVDKLRHRHHTLMEEKDKTVADAKAANLGLMKACKNTKAESGGDEL